jgi:hypothetical protein
MEPVIAFRTARLVRLRRGDPVDQLVRQGSA